MHIYRYVSTEHDVLDRAQWKEHIHVADPND